MGSKVVRFPESCELGNLTRSKASRDVEEQLERVEITVKEKRDEDSIRIVLISDTHNRHRSLKLPKGDILIHAGDFTNNGKEKEIKDFDAWLSTLDFQHKILVPGNHDTGTEEKALLRDAIQREKQGEILQVTEVTSATVLQGRTVEVMGLKIVGLPDTLDPYNLLWWAYRADTEEEMKKRAVAGISSGVDVLISHSPPWGVGDTCHDGQKAGSRGLREAVLSADEPPKLWAFGHIHECGGRAYRAKGTETVMVNAASCPLLGKELRPPIVIDICKETKAVLGVTVAHKEATVNGRDPHPIQTLFKDF